jgi:hypothetical protein
MPERESVARWMADRNLGINDMVRLAMLDRKVIEAIVQGRYTASPQQRQQIARALAVDPDEIAWDHTIEVQHIQGHGPQFGRSP